MPAPSLPPAHDSAALRAATLSFHKPPPTPSPSNPSPSLSRFNSSDTKASTSWSIRPASSRTPSKTSSHSRSNSALAATLAFARSPAPAPAPAPEAMSEEQLPDIGTVSARRKLFQDGGSTNVIAASHGSLPRSVREKVRSSRPPSPEKSAIDSAPIEDISSLKNRFESRSPLIHAPKPVSKNPSLTAAVLATQLSPPPSRRCSPERGPPSPTRSIRKRLETPSRDSLRSTPSENARSAATLAHAANPPKPPPPRKSGAAAVDSTAPTQTSETLSAGPPKPPPPRKPRLPSGTTVNSAPASVSETPDPIPSKPPPLPVRRTTSPARTAALQSHISASTVSLPLPRALTGESVIAASLAPSRTQTPGPRKPPPPQPPPTRRAARKSSPTKSPHLPSTLRPQRRARSPSPPRSRSLVNHKHKEASNPRYRTTISEKERKRYEGVWAANRGLLIPQKDGVVGLVVRDIWRRSCLGNRILAEIWEAVDRGQKGWLGREEFVVGMWLIDQALRGRKTPARVADSIWEAARRR